MEGVPATIGSSGGDGLSPQQQQASAQPHINGGGDDGGTIGGGFTEEGERNSGGNRWPKQETLALIKIRSEMDAAFRDSNLKAPLWDDVSRKLSELGFHRSAKKCREKFENVYKYHRRTKEGRTSKSDKTYRFFDQLQALESAFSPPPQPATKPPIFVTMSTNATTHPLPVSVPSFNLTGADQNNVSPISVAAPAVMSVPPPPALKRSFPFSQPNLSGSTNSDESYTSSDEEPPRKKRKWQEFFGKLMNEVIQKQEELQMKFLDTLERRERDRVAREEAWRAQEIAKMNQEHDRLIKERQIAAAKDAAVITFLQKMTGKTLDTTSVAAAGPLTPTIQPVHQQQQQQQIQKSPLPPPPSPPNEVVLPPVAVAVPVSVHPPPPPTISMAPPGMTLAPPVMKNFATGGGDNMLSPSPSRWPKAEINALISLRTQLDTKYQENVPKGPLWEDISAAMRKLGYNRNAKRCKEKWENINKYYKKMKEGNKKRPEDSKTCPYFHQLDAIYSEKANNNNSEQRMTNATAAIVARPEQQWPPATTPVAVQEKASAPAPSLQQQQQSNNNLGFGVKPETQVTPVASWPQQQWPIPAGPQQPLRQQPSTAVAEDQGSENDDDYDDDEDDEEEEDDDDDGGDEILPNKMSSMAAV